VVALENCNILPEVQTISCLSCTVKASYQVNQHPYCKRHIPKTHRILPELNGKKLPPNKVLKELVKQHDCELLGATNDKCIESLQKKFAFPFTQPKQTNASKVSLEVVHDALRSFVAEKWPVFAGCTDVLLENQPVFKNPHMKSVQVLLFAVLREQFLTHQPLSSPSYHFVHAKKKVADVQAGDAGYAERKQKSEERLVSLFETAVVTNAAVYDAWKASKKKSDMADALCMAVDYL